jgi:lysophospholipid acyltransferase (LPLAT)-like uncharacterized protein
MKLRHPLAIKTAAFLLSGIVRCWFATVTIRFTWDDPDTQPLRMGKRRGIYVFWHEMMLMPAYTHAQQGFAVLISQHADGELIAQIIRLFRGSAVRGSTNKRGLTALRDLMRRGKLLHLAITPDGPRGPRRIVQPGAIYVASRTGMPIVPVGLAYGGCWRLRRSWDRMAFPHPGQVAQGVAGVAIDVPPDLDRDGIEQYRQRVQAAMDGVQGRAERLAERWGEPLAPRPAGGVVARMTTDQAPTTNERPVANAR